jgi:hypothetical protein
MNRSICSLAVNNLNESFSLLIGWSHLATHGPAASLLRHHALPVAERLAHTRGPHHGAGIAAQSRFSMQTPRTLSPPAMQRTLVALEARRRHRSVPPPVVLLCNAHMMTSSPAIAARASLPLVHRQFRRLLCDWWRSLRTSPTTTMHNRRSQASIGGGSITFVWPHRRRARRCLNGRLSTRLSPARATAPRRSVGRARLPPRSTAARRTSFPSRCSAAQLTAVDATRARLRCRHRRRPCARRSTCAARRGEPPALLHKSANADQSCAHAARRRAHRGRVSSTTTASCIASSTSSLQWRALIAAAPLATCAHSRSIDKRISMSAHSHG